VTKYRTSISYQTSGERIQYTGTRPNGQSCSNIEVLSGAYAWNENIPGAELVPGKGKATPMPATVEERMIRLWASTVRTKTAAPLPEDSAHIMYSRDLRQAEGAAPRYLTHFAMIDMDPAAEISPRL
jgi:hypothetical protein